MHVADVVYNVYENEIYGMTSHLKTNVKISHNHNVPMKLECASSILLLNNK